MRSIWETLGLDGPTSDVKRIHKAFKKQKQIIRPNRDPQGYEQLKSAYRAALEFAKTHNHSLSESSNSAGKTTGALFAGFTFTLGIFATNWINESRKPEPDYQNRVEMRSVLKEYMTLTPEQIAAHNFTDDLDDSFIDGWLQEGLITEYHAVALKKEYARRRKERDRKRTDQSAK